MANSWKKIIDKVDGAPVSGPHASDWEAMNAKIAAHPSISNPKGRGGAWLKTGLGVVLLAVLGLGYLMYFPTEEGNADTTQNTTQAKGVKPESEVSAAERAVEESITDIDNSRIEEFQNKSEKASNVNSQKTTESIALVESADVVSGISVVENNVNDNQNSNETELQSEAKAGEVEEIISDPVVMTEEPTEAIVSLKLSETNDLEAYETDEPVEELEPFAPEEVIVAQNEVTEEEVVIDPVTSENTEETSLEENSSEQVIAEAENEPEEETPIHSESTQSLVQADEPESSVPAEPVNLRSAGFSLNGLNIGGGYSTDFSGNLYGTGVGIDVDIQRGGLLLNTGVHYYQMNTMSQFVNQTTNTNYSTRFNTVSDTIVTVVRDSAWVIDSAFAGHWADKSYTVTNITSTTDTINDTTVTKIETKEERRVKLSYLELPVLAGHRFRFNRFAIDLYGGLILNQLTTGTVEGTDIQKKFGMDAVLQPAVRYYLKPQLSVFARSGLRYGLVANEYRPQKLYGNFQIGLTYHW